MSYFPHCGMMRRDKAAIRRMQNNRCPLCGGIFGSGPVTFEHVLPRARGGGNRGNLVVTHDRCNKIRADAMPSGCLLLWLDVVNARLAA